MSTFAIYLIGFVIFVGGVLYAASLAGMSQTWILVMALVLVGLGIVIGATKTRRRDPAPPA